MSRKREEFDEIGKKLKTDPIDGHYCRHNSNNMGRRPLTTIAASNYTMINYPAAVLGGGGGGGGGGSLNTITPCAACKLLRRRCAEECPFSPYFSPHEPHKFAAVHKVFGASNVSKMLMDVGEEQRADAANSLVYEANVRLRDPIYGCMGAISALQQQVQALQAELNAVRAHILRFKYTREQQAAAAAAASANSSIIINAAAADQVASSQVATCNFVVSVAELASLAQQPVPPPPAPQLQPPPPASGGSTDPSSMYNSNSSNNNATYASIISNNNNNTTTHNSIPYFD